MAEMDARELARLFTARSGESAGGRRRVTTNLVRSWHHKRDKTGMPLPAGTRRNPGTGKEALVWDQAAALGWFLGWKPSKGGAPRGNKNAIRHGGFVGVRAQQEAAKQAP